jgi:hypothetical protein
LAYELRSRLSRAIQLSDPHKIYAVPKYQAEQAIHDIDFHEKRFETRSESAEFGFLWLSEGDGFRAGAMHVLRAFAMAYNVPATKAAG